MSTFCFPYISKPSIANAETIKYENLKSASLAVRKRNLSPLQTVYIQRPYRTSRRFLHYVSNPSLQIHTFKVLKAAKSNSEEAAEPAMELSSNFNTKAKGRSFLLRTESDGLVNVFVRVNEMKYTVYIEVHSLPQSMVNHNLMLLWGIFRSDSLLFEAPASYSSVSSTTKLKSEECQHPMKTLFAQDSSLKYMVWLDFDYSDIPFYLSFLLQPDGSELRIKTHRKTNFCVPVGLGPGYPMPLGVSLNNDGSANFSVFSRNSDSVILCLFENKTNEPSLELELDPYINRMGDIWHVLINNIANYIFYGYRCKDVSWSKGSRIPSHLVLLDPYAKMIGKVYDQGESASMAKHLGYLSKEPSFDWCGDTRPRIPMEKLVVYRLNVERFTKCESSKLAKNVVGTFRGVIEKVQHLINLGINAVLLEPVFSFDEKRGPYLPYHFFSPMSAYGGLDESKTSYSMKEMVKTLHAHKMEVFLEVVFTHTCETGDADGQILSLKGIDKSSYYFVDQNVHSEYSCDLKCNDPIVQQLILDSLHYWVTEFHIDGFCFIDSSRFLQGSKRDHLSRPPLVEAIAFDPLLSETKIISDCWSPLCMSYKYFIFPHWQRWAEMNTKYCHDIRNFLRGEGLFSNLATRICGSGDIFTGSRGPSYSFNYITKNAGLTLVDLVSFSSDDLASELSCNSGIEGPTDKKSVLEIRLRQVRNFLFILFISLGVPVMNMGDEFGYSTGGSPSYKNRTPICWSNLRTGFSVQITKFIAFLTSLRNRRSDAFQRKNFYNVENVIWHGNDQSMPNWEDPSSKFLALELKAERSSNSYGGDLFIAFNASNLPELATLPELSEEYAWFRLVDTSLQYPGFFSSDSISQNNEWFSSYEVNPHSCVLLEAKTLSI